MALYILSDKKLKSFLPVKDSKEVAAALALNQNRIKTKMLTKSADVITLKNDPEAVLFIASSLNDEYYKIIEYCNSNNIPVICAHEAHSQKSDCVYSTIRGNTVQVIKSLLAYSAYYNKTKPAFFALNRASSHDRRKASIIYDICENFSENDIYSVQSDFSACIESFFENRYSYDVIFCSNDFSAIALVEELKLRDPEYLDSVFVVGFMNTIISKLYSPSITTSSYSTDDVTKALLNIYRIYSKSDYIASIDIILNSPILTRQSTKNLPINSQEITQARSRYKSLGRVLEFDAKSIAEHSPTSPVIDICKKIETMLTNSKLIDFQILSELLQHRHNSEICDRLFISIQTLQYHLKKMEASVGAASKSELVEIISKYISLENLEKYISCQQI